MLPATTSCTALTATFPNPNLDLEHLTIYIFIEKYDRRGRPRVASRASGKILGAGGRRRRGKIKYEKMMSFL